MPQRELPVSLPFFGNALNLLPFLMTGVTIVSSWRFDDASLSPQRQARQRRSPRPAAASPSG